jgi:hypothetical protein
MMMKLMMTRIDSGDHQGEMMTMKLMMTREYTVVIIKER